MAFTANANATTETARHSMPQSTGSSTKGRSTPPCPPRTVYARVPPPQEANDTGLERDNKEIKDVPEVPPPSAFTRQYLDCDISTAAANYLVQLTAEVRSFRGWYARANNTAVGGDPLDAFFSEVKELEAAYRARRADPYKASSHEEEDGKESAQEESGEDDEDDKFLDALEWREEALESDMAPTADEASAHTEAVAHRTPSSVVVELTEEKEYYYSHETSVKHELVDSEWSYEDADIVKAEGFDADAWLYARDDSLEPLPHAAPAWSMEDDGCDASVSSDSDIDRHRDTLSATDTRSTHSYSPALLTPAARVSLFAHPDDDAAPIEHHSTHIECRRTGLTGLFGTMPAPVFLSLNTVAEAQATSPPTRRPREASSGVHRSQHSWRTRLNAPYRQHALRHSSMPRGERVASSAHVRRNATDPDLSGRRA